MAGGVNLRVRKVDANGDRVFGGDQTAFHRNTPQAVAQVCESRLNLWTSQWYLDLNEGTPYETDVLGFRTEATRDAVLQARILGSPGVSEIKSYSSALNRQSRVFAPVATAETIYSAANQRLTADGRVVIRLPVEQDR